MRNCNPPGFESIQAGKHAPPLSICDRLRKLKDFGNARRQMHKNYRFPLVIYVFRTHKNAPLRCGAHSMQRTDVERLCGGMSFRPDGKARSPSANVTKQRAHSPYPHSLIFDIAYSGTFLIQSCSR